MNIIDKTNTFLQNNIKSLTKKSSKFAGIDLYQFFSVLNSIRSSTYAINIVVLVALCARAAVGIGGYSGAQNPPMYGDYEAQRHWMEVTTQLPMEEWYTQTRENDLQYWGLDYPPLTAYFSWVVGYFSSLYDPESVALYSSRGYESDSHKTFMRLTVLISDIIFLITALIYFFEWCYFRVNTQIRQIALLITLLTPPLLLIDHGHFQYNCVMLGLTIWSINMLFHHEIVMTSLLFTLSLNYKQMALYYALAMFFYILALLWNKSGYTAKRYGRYFQNLPWVREYVRPAVLIGEVGITGGVVLLGMYIMWSPWAGSWQEISQVVQRVFPVGRGLFEDKVANFWCCCSIFLKFKVVFADSTLKIASLGLTMLALLPSGIHVLRRPSFKTFLLALFNISMAFFMFGYQVHEKSILLPLMPASLLYLFFPREVENFVVIATFSLYPLLKKDGLPIQYFCCLAGYLFVSRRCSSLIAEFVNRNKRSIGTEDSNPLQSVFQVLRIEVLTDRTGAMNLLMNFCYVLMALYHFLDFFVAPPSRYPDLWVLLNCWISFGFMGFLWLNFYYEQLIQVTLEKEEGPHVIIEEYLMPFTPLSSSGKSKKL